MKRPGFNPWVGKIPWRREWLPTPIFLPREFHEQRSLAGPSPGDHRVGHDWGTLTFKDTQMISKHMKRCSMSLIISSAQFSRSVVSDSLQHHESQHARPPCPSQTPGVHSCPSSRWCHPTISSSVVPFSSCPQSLPASGSFPMSQLFTWGGQSIGV